MYEKEIYKREITCKIDLYPFEGKSYGYYIVIPFTLAEQSSKRTASRRQFWLRVFSSDKIDIGQVKDTLMIEEKGDWNEKKPCGPMYLEVNEEDDEKSELKYNPYWCQNPQYFLNMTQPTKFKIILKKDKETTKKNDKIKIGLLVCQHWEKREQEIDTKKSVNVRQGVITDQTVKLLKQTKEFLEPPKMQYIERKLEVSKFEEVTESSFMNTDIAALYFKCLPINGPLVIIPCQSEKSKNNNYTLRIYSDKKVTLRRLDESKNVCLVGNWGTSTSGGCELFNEYYYKNMDLQSWSKNPKFQLVFEEPTIARVKIVLTIADKNWRGKVATAIKKKKEKELKEQKELMEEKKYGTSQIPEKSEDVKFLKSSMTMLIFPWQP